MKCVSVIKVITKTRPDCTTWKCDTQSSMAMKIPCSTFLSKGFSLKLNSPSATQQQFSNSKFDAKKQIKPDLWFDEYSSNARVIFGQTKLSKQYVLINGSPHLFGHDFKELRLWVILDYAKDPVHKHLSVSFLCPPNDIHAKSHSAVSLLTAGKCN